MLSTLKGQGFGENVSATFRFMTVVFEKSSLELNLLSSVVKSKYFEVILDTVLMEVAKAHKVSV
jgi:hypothetical protein